MAAAAALAPSTAEDPSRPSLGDRIPSAPARPKLSDAGRPLLRRLNSTAGGLFQPPTLQNLKGKWHVTHSTLPIWKDKRNVTITYTIIPEKSGHSSPSGDKKENDKSVEDEDDLGSAGQKLEDVIEYQEMGKSKICSVKGVDTIPDGADARSWNWRGKGIIKIASSHWEILGWGVDDGTPVSTSQSQQADGSLLDEKVNGVAVNGVGVRSGESTPSNDAHERQWMVTYFAKTYFTPAGMDIYSRHPDGVSEKLFNQIRQALQEINAPHLAELAGKLYEVKRDGDRR